MQVSSPALPQAGPSSPVQNKSIFGIPSLSPDSDLVPSPNQWTKSNTYSSLKTIFADSTIHGNVSLAFNSTTQYGCKRRHIRVIDSESKYGGDQKVRGKQMPFLHRLINRVGTYST